MKSIFSKFTISEIRNKKLKEYELTLFNSEESAAYHAKMTEFYREAIKRLSKL